MQFLIIHGSFGSPKANWVLWLNNELESLGQKVIVPHFPVDDWDVVTANGPNTPTANQTLNHWLSTFKPLVPRIKSQPTIAVGHSLSPLFFLHTTNEYNISYESGIFVAPFLSKLGCDWQIDLANQTFYQDNFDWESLKTHLPISYIIYAQDDPYVKEEFPRIFAEKLGSQIIVTKTGGHFNTDSGFTQFPLLLELCKTRIESKF